MVATPMPMIGDAKLLFQVFSNLLSNAVKYSPNGGTISKRHLLSIEGTHPAHSISLFDVLLPVAPPRPHN